MRVLPTVIACSLTSSALLAAESATIDKSPYNLFNPTPTEAMRPLESEEADKVVSPYTVDAGHFQIEGDLISYYDWSRSRFIAPGVEYTLFQDQFAWKPRINVGLLNNVDFEVQANYAIRKVEETLDFGGGAKFKQSDTEDIWGEVQPLLKINLWGNDGGTTALALTPFLSIPTEDFDDRNINGGFGLPFAVHLPEDFRVKIFPEVFFFEGFEGSTEAEFSNNASISKALTPHFELFANINTLVSTEADTDWAGYAGLGGAYTFGSHFELYAGVRFGLTDNAYDHNPYLGFAYRF